MAAGVAGQLFRFQFSAYAIELPSSGSCGEECTNVTLAFRLFDFPSVLLQLQRTPASVQALLVEHLPRRSGVVRCRVRGGKSCLFSMPTEQLKHLSKTSQLYVMLTRLKSPSPGGPQDAADDQLLAASTVSLHDLVETCLAYATPSWRRHSVSLYRGSQLYAKATVKLSLERVQVAAEERGGGGGGAGVDLRRNGATEQSNSVRRVGGTRQQAPEGQAHVGPPAMLLRGCRPKLQPTTQEMCSGVKTSLLDSEPVPTGSYSPTNTDRRTVWPNGYIEEVVCDETVLAAADPLPNTHKAHTNTSSTLEYSGYPILQALLKELSIIKSHAQEVQFQEHPADVPVVAPELSDKCLQTEERIVVPSPTHSGRVRHRADEPTPQRPFVRTCCAMKHVPGEQEATVLRPIQAKPLQTALQSKVEVLPMDSNHPTTPTEGQTETAASVQLPASITPPPSVGGDSVFAAPEVEGSAPLYTKVPTTCCTMKEAASGVKQVYSHQGLSSVREADSRDDKSDDRHVDRSDGHIDSSDHRTDRHDDRSDSRGDKSDGQVDRRDQRSDNHVDSSDDRSDRHVDSSDGRKHHKRPSSVDDFTAVAPCVSSRTSPRGIHSIDNNTSIGSGVHPTKKHTHVSDNSDSTAVSQKVHSVDGGGQLIESLRLPSSPDVDTSGRDMRKEVQSTTGYSVDSLEEGRNVDTPTGFSSDTRDSYTEDFESGSDFSQDRDQVSNSDWNPSEHHSQVPVDDERTSTSVSTTSLTISSTLHTTDH